MQVSVDPKQVRVKCPTCEYPVSVLSTICHVCGNRLDPHEQWLVYEKAETRTV